MDKKESRLYEFDQFYLDASEHILLYDMQEVPLTPKVFETLLLLVENSGHVVRKEELLSTIWPDSIVEEGSLSQNISLLRKALGDSRDGQRFIATIPKRGYKFIAPVKAVNNNAPAVDVLPYHSVITEAALKKGTETHTPQQEEVPLQFGPQSTSSTFRLNFPFSRILVVIVIILAILMLAVACGMYFWAVKGPANVKARNGNRVTLDLLAPGVEVTAAGIGGGTST